MEAGGGEYMNDLQSVDVAEYLHPCVFFRGRDFCSMLACSELAVLLVYKRFAGCGWPKSLLKIHTRALKKKHLEVVPDHGFLSDFPV